MLFINRKNQGFVLVFALAIGLVITMIGLAMYVRSAADVDKILSQVNAANAQSAAEIGYTRFREYLNDNRILAKYSKSVWQDVVNGVNSDAANTLMKYYKACDTDEQWTTKKQFLSDWLNSNWIDLGNNNQYRIIDYSYNTANNTGTVIIEGRTGQSEVSGIRRLQMSFPVYQDNTPLSLPGLWLKTDGDGTGNNMIDARQVWFNNCVMQSQLGSVRVQNGVAKISQIDFPSLPTPNLSLIPASQKNMSISSDLTLPRKTDNPVLVDSGSSQIKVYQYIVNSIVLGSGTLTINTIQNAWTIGKDANGNDIRIPTKDSSGNPVTERVKVEFYLTGSIDKGGQFVRNCTGDCKTTDFAIYAYGGNGSVDFDVSDVLDPHICVNGNNEIAGFIFAPGYRVGAAGTGGGNGGFKGAVWAGSWDVSSGCGSNQTNYALVQDIAWDQLNLNYPNNPLPLLGATSSWNQQPQTLSTPSSNPSSNPD